MATLDAAIDDVYKAPLQAFVSTRTALAKTLTGADAKRVKGLAKPTVVPWAVNQVYWHARPAYDGITETGKKLRESQIAALNGRSTDIHAANAAHRAAVGEAVKAATQLASAHGVNPDADALARMFEAISLTTTPPEAPGRFTKPLQPAGFEALAGITIAPGALPEAPRRADPAAPEKHAPADIAPRHAAVEAPKKPALTAVPSKRDALRIAAEEKRARDAERERLAAEQRKQIAIRSAESEVSRARTVEARAREAWDRAKAALDEAERALDKARD